MDTSVTPKVTVLVTGFEGSEKGGSLRAYGGVSVMDRECGIVLKELLFDDLELVQVLFFIRGYICCILFTSS